MQWEGSLIELADLFHLHTPAEVAYFVCYRNEDVLFAVVEVSGSGGVAEDLVAEDRSCVLSERLAGGERAAERLQ